MTQFRLDEVATITSGNSIPARDRKGKFSALKVQGRPFISTKDVGFDGVVRTETDVAIPQSYASDFKLAPAFSTLVCSEGGSAGRKIGWLDSEVHFGNKLFSVSAKPSVDPKFLHYFHLTDDFSDQFKERMTGLIGGVSLKKFKSIALSLPPMDEQKRIVAVLDQAFAALERARANAEANLADAEEILVSYVDAMTTGAKSEEVQIGTICDLHQGLAINKKTKHLLVNNSSLPLLRIKDLRDGTHEQYVAEVGYPENARVFEHEIIYTRTGQIGLVFRGREGVIHNNCFKISPRRGVYPDYIFWAVQGRKFRERVFELAQRAAQPDITHKIFKIQRVCIPSFGEQQAVARKIETVSSQADALLSQCQSKLSDLDDLRRSILQKAFAGELT